MALVIPLGKLYKFRMQILKGHGNNPFSPNFKIDYGIKGDCFWVEGIYQGELNTNSSFDKEGYKNWGLWEFDVFELFLTRQHKDGHYIEIQFSPLDQKLALYIKRPREEYEFFHPETFEVVNNCDDEGWKFKCSVLASDIPGDGLTLSGNLHACLLESKSRCYLGTNLNKEQKPDFHRPDLFIKLGEFDG